MGGFGSGRNYYGADRRTCRRKTKLFVGNLPTLNIVDLLRQHQKHPGSRFTWRNIGLAIDGMSIRLEATDGRDLSTTTIQTVMIPCHYGGYRFFGCCPRCARRVRDLYLWDRNSRFFACRRCFNLAYISQNTTLSYRLRQKRKKIGKLINNDAWNKPKWMRKKTFGKLRTLYFDLDEMSQMAGLFSSRNHRQVAKLKKKYAMAVFAAKDLMEKHYGPILKRKK